MHVLVSNVRRKAKEGSKGRNSIVRKKFIFLAHKMDLIIDVLVPPALKSLMCGLLWVRGTLTKAKGSKKCLFGVPILHAHHVIDNGSTTLHDISNIFPTTISVDFRH